MFANAFVALVVVPVLVASAQGGQSCTRSYTIQSGDICDQISAANNVSTYQLAVVNDGIVDEKCDNLNPGSTICLGWAGQDCTNTYVVKLGDTCDEISYAYNLNYTIFSANNPQLNHECTNLYVGEVVCTAPTVLVPPPPASGTVPGGSIPPTSVPADAGLPYCDEI